MQASIFLLLPSVILSGFFFPIESMPRIAQWVSAALPLTYYLRIVRGIVVKGIGIEYLWQDTLILAIMGVITLVLAASRVRKSLANGKVGASCRLNRLFKSWKLVALG